MKEILITSSVMILAVIALRFLFRGRVSRRLIYGAWLLVALRLLIPIQFGQLDFSVLTQAKPVTDAITQIGQQPISGPSREELYHDALREQISQGTPVFIPEIQDQVDTEIQHSGRPAVDVYDEYLDTNEAEEILLPEVNQQIETAVSEKAAPSLGQIALWIWLGGMVVMASWFLCVNLSLHHSLRLSAVDFPTNSPIPVKVSPILASPCLFGLFRPVIYLTPACTEDDRHLRHVLTHEQTHLRHADHIWAWVRCLCLCIYWFNPLVWVAAYLSKRDCELACDEAALKILGEEERLAYGRTLVDMVALNPAPGQLLETATAMHESKKQLKERVNRIVKKPKLFLTAAIALLLVLSIVTGCAFTGPAARPTGTPDSTAPTTLPTDPPTTAEPEVGVTFPLEETVTLTLTMSTAHISALGVDFTKTLAQNKLWNDLYEMTNVHIEIRVCDDPDTLNAMIQNGNFGDIISLSLIPSSARNELIENGKLLAIDKYISNPGIMPNFHQYILSERPEVSNAFTSFDGHIYSLGYYDAEIASYLDSPIWVNKTWLDMANMTAEDISTLDGLEKWFDWIVNSDPNNNGIPDELPCLRSHPNSSSSTALLGMWGIPTKDMRTDFYCYLNDGKVIFAPATEAWRSFTSTMARWNSNGWINGGALHETSDSVNYPYLQNTYLSDNGLPERVGMLASSSPPTRNAGSRHPDPENRCEYIVILPPKVDGYETRWYLHPSYMGTKDVVAIAANTQYPEICCAWLDLFYSPQINLRSQYGEEGSAWRITDENGKITSSKNFSNQKQAELLRSGDSYLQKLIPCIPKAVTNSMLENDLSSTEVLQKLRSRYSLYQDVLNTEVWPRPSYSKEANAELEKIWEDVSHIVISYHANWVNGKENIDTEWNTFQKELKDAGVERMVEILQQSYDTWLEAANE